MYVFLYVSMHGYVGAFVHMSVCVYYVCMYRTLEQLKIRQKTEFLTAISH